VQRDVYEDQLTLREARQRYFAAGCGAVTPWRLDGGRGLGDSLVA
jgi:hypothetical protein